MSCLTGRTWCRKCKSLRRSRGTANSSFGVCLADDINRSSAPRCQVSSLLGADVRGAVLAFGGCGRDRLRAARAFFRWRGGSFLDERLGDQVDHEGDYHKIHDVSQERADVEG